MVNLVIVSNRMAVSESLQGRRTGLLIGKDKDGRRDIQEVKHD